MAVTIGREVCKLFSRRNPTNYQKVAINVQQLNLRFASFNAAVLKEFNKPLEIQEMKSKEKLKGDQIRVKVHACGVNASDILICQGAYDVKPKLPCVPGFEIAGEVKQVGPDVKGLNEGDRIVGLNKQNFFGFSEECILSAKDTWVLPHSVKYEQGAALADTYATALLGLARRANLQEGDTVLVSAAAGGLGLAAVDVASNVYKAKVIGVCGTEDKADLVRKKGAWSALRFVPKDLQNTVKDVTDGKGVDVIFDAVGGEVFEECVKNVAHEGKMIVAGFASRKVPKIETSILLPKSFSLIGVSLSNYRQYNYKVYREIVQDVIDMCEQHLIAPYISAKFTLKDVNEAFEFISEKKSTGKVVLNIE